MYLQNKIDNSIILFYLLTIVNYDILQTVPRKEVDMDRLMTLREACGVMGISYSKGQKLAKAGELPFRKIGSSWRIPQSTLYRELNLEPPKEEVKEAMYV